MVAKLSTTINKIENLSNSPNSKTLIEFLTYMKNNGSSERHQNFRNDNCDNSNKFFLVMALMERYHDYI
jgi:hypothetical protein